MLDGKWVFITSIRGVPDLEFWLPTWLLQVGSFPLCRFDTESGLGKIVLIRLLCCVGNFSNDSYFYTAMPKLAINFLMSPVQGPSDKNRKKTFKIRPCRAG